MKLVFPIVVIIIVVLALLYPPMFLWLTSWIVPFLGVAMFGMGITLVPEDFKIVLTNPKLIIAALAAQYVIMPGLAFIIVHIFGLSPALAIGVILVGTCPGGTSSNIITYLAKGDLALSVSMTACSTLISPILTPILTLLLAGQWINVNISSMFFSILKIVIIPVAFGMLANKLLANHTKKITKFMPIVSMTAVILIIGAVVAINASKLFTIAITTIVVVIIHNLCGLTGGYLIGRMLKFNKKQCKTLSIEVGLQNSGLATSLAKIHFVTMPEAMLPAAVFSVWHNIAGALVAGYWSRKTKKINNVEGI